MWIAALFLFLLPKSQGWEIEKKYEYVFQNTIFRGDKSTNLAVGLFQFKWESEELLTGRIIPKYVKEIITDENFLVLPKVSLQAVFKDGQVVEVEVPEAVTDWQLEFIRGIVGLLQISDVSKEEDKFSVIEETVAGKCLTYYTVLRSSRTINVTKVRNYTDCEKIPIYERGIYGTENFEALVKKNSIIKRDSKGVFVLKNGHEIETAKMEERIEIFENSSKYFLSTEVKITSDLSALKFYKEPTDNLDFEIGNLRSVGGLMYQAKLRNSVCGRNISENCPIDYYMNPDKFGSLYGGSEVLIAEKLVKQITDDLEAPGRVFDVNILGSFGVLVGVIRSMNTSQLQEVAKLCEGEKSKRKNFVFQSGIFQSGTLDSLKMIRILKKSGKLQVQGMAVNELPEKVHPLSLEYLDNLFELVADSEIMEKDFDFGKDLLLAFGNLIRRYVSEVEKPFEQKQLNTMISKNYRRFFSKKLQEALNSNDDIKFQVFARALGNTADSILFKSYLAKNSDKLTEFQKIFIINVMDKAVEMYPKKSRDILLKLYENSNETSSVRTAAALKIVKTDLDEDMLIYVINVAKYSKDAQILNAVKYSVLSKEFNYHSNEKIRQQIQTMEIDSDFQRHTFFRFTGDKVNLSLLNEMIFDKAVGSFSTRIGTNKKGFKSTMELNAVLDKILIRRILPYAFGFSTVDIYKIFSANIAIESDFSQIFLPLVDLNYPTDFNLIRYLQQNNRIKINYLTMDEISLGFPTETGLPFFYTSKFPKFVLFEGATNFDDAVTSNINFVWSDRRQMEMGFVNPLTKKFYAHGSIISRHVNIPLTVSYKKMANVHHNSNVFVVEPIVKDERIVHLSTWPYSDVVDFFPVEADSKNVGRVLFHGEAFLDDTERFKVEVASSKVGNILGYFKGNELREYFFGAFSPTEPSYNHFNFYFNEDKDHKTSLIVKIDVPNDKLYVPEKGENSSFVEEQKIFEIVVKLSGRTSRSIAVESLFEQEPKSKDFRFSLTGSYWENDVMSYEADFLYVYQRSKQRIWTTSVEDQKKALFGIGNNTKHIFCKLTFGKTSDERNFISAETEIGNRRTSSKNLCEFYKLTVDFKNLPRVILREICGFDRSVLREIIWEKLRPVVKDPDKCAVDVEKT